MNLEHDLNALALPFVLLLCRFGGLFLALPVFSSQALPGRMRVMLSVALAATFLVAVPHPAIDMSLGTLVLVAFTELLLGYAVGFVTRLILASMELAAEFAGMQMGFGFAQTMNPLTRQSSGPVTQLLVTAGGLIFLVVGGHHQVLRAMASLFRILPLGSLRSVSSEWLHSIVGIGAGVFASGFRIAAPLLFVAFATHITFGLLTRVAPQLNVWALGFLFSISIGLVAMAILSPVLGGQLVQLVDSGLARALGLLVTATERL